MSPNQTVSLSECALWCINIHLTLDSRVPWWTLTFPSSSGRPQRFLQPRPWHPGRRALLCSPAWTPGVSFSYLTILARTKDKAGPWSGKENSVFLHHTYAGFKDTPYHLIPTLGTAPSLSLPFFVSLCSPGWLWTQDPPALAFQVLRSQIQPIL